MALAPWYFFRYRKAHPFRPGASSDLSPTPNMWRHQVIFRGQEDLEHDGEKETLVAHFPAGSGRVLYQTWTVDL